MKILTCLLVLLLASCGQGEPQVGDPCKPDGWCCLDSEYVECNNGILELGSNPKGLAVCKTREPGYKPCT